MSNLSDKVVGSGGAPPVIHVQDQKASGIAGGSSVVGQQTRTLNTVVTNTISGASLASNQITLPAGTYEVWASAPGNRTGNHKIKLHDILGSDVAIGTSQFSNSAGGYAQTTSTILGHTFTISTTTTFELLQYTQTARATIGLGVATSSGDIEVYADVRIVKVA